MRITSHLQSIAPTTPVATRVVLPLVVLLSANAAAEPVDWHNADGGNFEFEARYQGEPIRGRFKDFTVDFRFDPDLPGDARLVVKVNLAGADMGDADMNSTLYSPAWFNTSKFSTSVYQADEVERREDGLYIARGVLNLKGLEKRVLVAFQWWGEGDNARMQGSAVLNRTHFNVGTGEWSSGDSIDLEVRLDFDIPMEPEE